ncbi:MAG: leucine--tRNA ligase [Candidatus Staskawiczbacteria bacterium]|nr:leucine--tRNA ligase [Candidatus Staskawiczbacteria bacterium]
MKRYNPQQIEKKWQEKWYKSGDFKAKNFSKKKKFYLLFEFPYPSGDGLHVGHCRPYIGLDVIARKKRMQGYNLLFPIGWDAFGLPTENYAIKKGIHPVLATKKNTDNFRKQMKMLGLSLDWAREVNTTDPKYYKWTQWIFIKLFENGLAYKDKMLVNWCPKDKIVLANEEVISGKCERCGADVEKKEKEQWLIRITNYAERLLEDLNMVDYPERVKIQQKDWIGKSEGAIVKFPVEGFEDPIEVFTTRIDTIFSGTYLILSPGHKFIERHKDKIENLSQVLEYIKKAKNTPDIERSNLEKDVTGIELKGVLARNPATNEEMPIWVADFVLEQYGTGAVFADAHDKRDFKLAKKYGIPLRTSIIPKDEEFSHKVKNLEECYEGEGVLHNSMQFDGLESSEAKTKIILWLKEKNLANTKTSYKLRDWIFSRQHYWGEPIPMIFCQNCDWQTISEKDLPVELPNVKKYQPTDTGESPLASIEKWVNVKCKKCGGPAKRETDTMPNWAGSNWYFLRYTDPKNNKALADNKILKYWLPVDWYNGGMEHTTLHLLYSRFIFKFLYDILAVPESVGSEPYKKRTSHGVILGEGGIKMSKSRGNVVNPDIVAKQYGSDTLRVYEMFIGPFEQQIPWDQKGVVGCRRFLEKVYNLTHNKISKSESDESLKILLNKTIKKVGEDIELMKFNTAVSSLMEFVNEWSRLQINRGSSKKSGQISSVGLSKKDFKKFLVILSPFAPHLAEELWKVVGFAGFCSQQKWPKYNEKLLKEEKVFIIVQINGKVRDKIQASSGLTQGEAENLALDSKKIKEWVKENKPKKIIFIQDKLINIVI